MQLFKGDLVFVLLPFVLRKLGCASAAEVTMADHSGEWGIEKGDCASNNHPHEKSFSAFQNKSNNRPVAMATTALFKDETWDLCLINTSPSLLFHLSLSDEGSRPELSRSKRWSNGCSLKAPLYPGNHSLYMATSITAATNITSHMSCSPLSGSCVSVGVCIGQFNGRALYQQTGCFDGDSKQSHFDCSSSIDWRSWKPKLKKLINKTEDESWQKL